ncbi:MAG: universal stress protein, partial [Phycisphaerales bacterium]
SHCGAELYVVHAASSETIDILGSMLPEAKDISHQVLKEQALEMLKNVVDRAGLPVKPKYEVRVGKPHKEIIAMVEEIGADLLIIGATGQTGRRMGTVSGRCVRSSPVSVLMVTEEHHTQFQRIVACVDFSEKSPAVVREAAAIAKMEKADLSAVYVYHIPDFSPFRDGSSDRVNDAAAEFPKVMKQRFKDQIEPLAEGHPISFSLVEHIDYSKGVIAHVENTKVDLVVTGTTSRSKLGYAIMGTTAEKVIRDVGCAVLAVK